MPLVLGSPWAAVRAGYCGYEMTNHHHALADAEACAIIAKQIL